MTTAKTTAAKPAARAAAKKAAPSRAAPGGHSGARRPEARATAKALGTPGAADAAKRHATASAHETYLWRKIGARWRDGSRERAACRDTPNPEVFHSFLPGDKLVAYAHCAVCPIREECAMMAASCGETGIWGGAEFANGRRVSGPDKALEELRASAPSQGSVDALLSRVRKTFEAAMQHRDAVRLSRMVSISRAESL